MLTGANPPFSKLNVSKTWETVTDVIKYSSVATPVL